MTEVRGHSVGVHRLIARQDCADKRHYVKSGMPRKVGTRPTLARYQLVPSSPGITHRPLAATRPMTMLS